MSFKRASTRYGNKTRRGSPLKKLYERSKTEADEDMVHERRSTVGDKRWPTTTGGGELDPEGFGGCARVPM